jgi:hypothetical protein
MESARKGEKLRGRLVGVRAIEPKKIDGRNESSPVRPRTAVNEYRLGSIANDFQNSVDLLGTYDLVCVKVVVVMRDAKGLRYRNLVTVPGTFACTPQVQNRPYPVVLDDLLETGLVELRRPVEPAFVDNSEIAGPAYNTAICRIARRDANQREQN